MFFYICGSASEDSTNCRSCSAVVFTIEKNWTCVVQTPAVQGSAVQVLWKLDFSTIWFYGENEKQVSSVKIHFIVALIIQREENLLK